MKNVVAMALSLLLGTVAFASVQMSLSKPIPLPGGAHRLLKYRFSDAEHRALISRLQVSSSMQLHKEPSTVQLGMNGVPVLNQGVHGTCVTFAVSAAIDAALFLGDGISQLCFLAHGKYLEQMTGWPSGWRGATGWMIVRRFQQYGYILRDFQLANGCGGLYEYPGGEPQETGQPMPTRDYREHSTPLPDNIIWRIALNQEESLGVKYDQSKTLSKVKNELALGNRVTFSYLLDVEVRRAGAAGKHVRAYDSYIMTDAIEEHLRQGRVHYGHYAIITGYDDEAIADGHRGLFKVRVSWGPYAGDHGDYYMSYEYFSRMVLEVNTLATDK